MEAVAATETTTSLRWWGSATDQNLINSLFEYKRIMTYKNLDFDTENSMRCKKAQIKIGLQELYQKILKIEMHKRRL